MALTSAVALLATLLTGADIPHDGVMGEPLIARGSTLLVSEAIKVVAGPEARHFLCPPSFSNAKVTFAVEGRPRWEALEHLAQAIGAEWKSSGSSWTLRETRTVKFDERPRLAEILQALDKDPAMSAAAAHDQAFALDQTVDTLMRDQPTGWEQKVASYGRQADILDCIAALGDGVLNALRGMNRADRQTLVNGEVTFSPDLVMLYRPASNALCWVSRSDEGSWTQSRADFPPPTSPIEARSGLEDIVALARQTTAGNQPARTGAEVLWQLGSLTKRSVFVGSVRSAPLVPSGNLAAQVVSAISMFAEATLTDSWLTVTPAAGYDSWQNKDPNEKDILALAGKGRANLDFMASIARRFTPGQARISRANGWQLGLGQTRFESLDAVAGLWLALDSQTRTKALKSEVIPFAELSLAAKAEFRRAIFTEVLAQELPSTFRAFDVLLSDDWSQMGFLASSLRQPMYRYWDNGAPVLSTPDMIPEEMKSKAELFDQTEIKFYLGLGTDNSVTASVRIQN